MSDTNQPLPAAVSESKDRPLSPRSAYINVLTVGKAYQKRRLYQ
jgi:hypothetical protein